MKKLLSVLIGLGLMLSASSAAHASPLDDWLGEPGLDPVIRQELIDIDREFRDMQRRGERVDCTDFAQRVYDACIEYCRRAHPYPWDVFIRAECNTDCSARKILIQEECERRELGR